MTINVETNPSVRFFAEEIIPNTGSTARDHLAKDRNWMQWSRLGSNLSVIGILLCLRASWPSLPDNRAGSADWPIGIVFFVVSLLSIIVGVLEYWHVHSQMAQNKLIAHSGPFTQAAITAVSLLVIGVCIERYVTQNHMS